MFEHQPFIMIELTKKKKIFEYLCKYFCKYSMISVMVLNDKNTSPDNLDQAS